MSSCSIAPFSSSRSRAAFHYAFAPMFALAALAASWMVGSAQAADIWVENRQSGGSYIFISGQIVNGDEKRFAALHPASPVYVRPSGSGGATYVALEIADTIWDRGYNTLLQNVDGPCASACAFIWLSGRHVIVQNSARLYFHSCFDTQTNRDSMECDADVATHLLRYGYTKSQAWALATATPHTTARLGTKGWAASLGFQWQTLWSLFGANGCTVRFCLLVP